MEIAAINSGNSNDFHLALNKFADWSPEEYSALMGYKPSSEKLLGDGLVKVLPTDNLPKEINWVTSGAVTPVKNQAACGSCWTFSAISCMEGHHKIKANELLDLSEQ